MKKKAPQQAQVFSTKAEVVNGKFWDLVIDPHKSIYAGSGRSFNFGLRQSLLSELETIWRNSLARNVDLQRH